VPLANIADLMGHADLATTQIYAKVQIEHLRDAVERVTPLVPNRPSLKSVTSGGNEPDDSAKLVESGDLEAGCPAWLGGRESKKDHSGSSSNDED
jgi:hypothetical protein